MFSSSYNTNEKNNDGVSDEEESYTNLYFPVALASVLTTTSFAQSAEIVPVSAKDVEVVPISYQIKHWSEVFIDQLSKDYDVKDVFDGKNLNSTIEVKDFQNLVRVVLDKDYDGSPDSLSREAVVHELMKIWADKTGKILMKLR